MNRALFAITAFALALLAGCDDAPRQQNTATDRDTPPVAKNNARDCPARPASFRRVDGAPVDDIVGLQPGMSYDDVMWVLQCRDDVPTLETAEKWNIKQTYDFPIRQLIRASNGTPCTGQEIVRDMSAMGSRKTCEDGGYRLKPLKGISQEFDIVFTGMPGQEKAGAIWRRTVFPETESPTVQSLLQSLGSKYGEPHVNETDRRGRVTLSWVYDLLNRPMSRASKDFNACSNGPNALFSSSQGWRAACGLTIKAMITPLPSNDLLAQAMHIGVMHQKNFYDDGQSFENELMAAYQQRKQEEAARASVSGEAPDM